MAINIITITFWDSVELVPKQLSSETPMRIGEGIKTGY